VHTEPSCIYRFQNCRKEKALFFGNCFRRTNACACTAADTSISIDNARSIRFTDSAYGAFALACTAINASIGDLISHSHTP